MNVNDRLVRWITDRVKNKYADDIALVLSYGSYVNGTANSKSDVDCYFIPKTERGYEAAVTFILDGIGYDFFPMSWERVENIAMLRDVLAPCVGDVKVLYCSSEEDMKRFQKMQSLLTGNLQNRELCERIANERFEIACKFYVRLKNSSGLSECRMYAGRLLMALADTVAVWNQEYYHYGLKRQYEDLQRFGRKPDRFVEQYLGIMRAETPEALKSNCFDLLSAMSVYSGWRMDVREERDLAQGKAEPDCAFLAGLYEEIGSTFNKIYVCAENDHPILAFLSAVCLQAELWEAAGEQGTPKYDLLSAYHYGDLLPLAERTREVETAFVKLITEGGGKIKRFADFAVFEQTDL